MPIEKVPRMPIYNILNAYKKLSVLAYLPYP